MQKAEVTSYFYNTTVSQKYEVTSHLYRNMEILRSEVTSPLKIRFGHSGKGEVTSELL
jgi:hypothetical protein